ncbi:MAG: hypothetical protein BroJett011_05290 [Chloroflexota bacterium]|nr:MAG: hypothetical protein BroJett011_05290 [Chloroflexota bacterium]
MRFQLWPKLDYGLLLALVLPLFAVLPLLTHPGLPNTADGPAHLMRQVELNQAWQEGNFYPRWGTDLAFGHGMPIFSYAPPALYQLTQLFHLLGLPLDEAMKAVLIFDFLLYSVGMFLLARRIFGPGPALLAAALYVYAPYRLREAYIQGNYGQFTGLAFYPLILWACHGLVTTGQPGYLVAAAFSLAGLLFSHNISFMLFAPLLAAYLLFLLILTVFSGAKRRRGEEANDNSYASRFTLHVSHFMRSFLALMAAGLLGLGLAAIFWLPAFGERHEIQLEGITRGFFDFRANFISLPEFFSPPLPLDLAAINPEFPLSLGLPQIIGAGIGLAVLLFISIKLNKQRISRLTNQPQDGPTRNPLSSNFHLHAFTHALFFAFFLLLYTFLALPYSQPIWEAVPLLELAEFPWRMLGPAIFCTSLLAALPFTKYDLRFTIFKPEAYPLNPNIYQSKLKSKFNLPSSILYLLISIFAAIALNAYYLYPTQFIVWGTPTPADAFAYEVTSGAIGTTSTGEFLPRSARQHPRPDTLWPDYAAGRPPQKIDPATLPSGATVETISHRAESDTFRIRTPQAFVATIRTLYWPGWQLYLDDQPAAFTVTEPTGLIQTTVPAGEHTLTLKLESTSLRTLGQGLTLGAFVILVIIAGFALRKRPAASAMQRVKLPAHTPASQAPLTGRFFVITSALLVTAYLVSRPLAPFFTLRSNPDRPQPADQILQVDFGLPAERTPLLRLVGADNLPQTLPIPNSGKNTLTAILYWRSLRELDANYSVFLHLDAPNGQTYATADEVHPENIPTRNWPSGLYLRNPLHLEIPADLPPIRYEVKAGLYNRQSNERLAVLPGGEVTTFTLGSIWLTSSQLALPSQPLAHFGPHITLWQVVYPSAGEQTVVLSWQTDQPLKQNDTVFVHLLDSGGNLLAQADGAPYAGLYPLSNWQPGQIITDKRPLSPLLSNPADLAAIAVGIYNPVSGERLPAADAASQPLPDNSFILRVKP